MTAVQTIKIKLVLKFRMRKTDITIGMNKNRNYLLQIGANF